MNAFLPRFPLRLLRNAAFIVLGAVCIAVAGLFLHAFTVYHRNEGRIDLELKRLAAILDDRDPGAPVQVPGNDDGELVLSVALNPTASAPSRIFDVSGNLVAEFARLDQRFIRSTNALPAFVIPILIATEDRDFRAHGGYSVKGIVRAALVNLRHLSAVQGGSTLTQQLAKTLFTTRKKHLSRKLFEVFCAREIERRFTKDQILLLYLNLAYFGHGNHGIQNASYSFFGKPASSMSFVECAHLVGLLANPGIYSPRSATSRSMKRHKVVMGGLVAQGIVGEDWARREYNRYWEGVAAGALSRANALWPMSVNRAPYFVEWMRRDLDRLYPDELIQRGGFRIHCTLDLELQEIAEAILAESLFQINRDFPDLPASNRIEGALVAIDNRTGAVLAAVGGSRFSLENQLLRFEQVQRPVGSLAKPLVYLLAFHRLGYTAATELDDAPMKIRIPDRVWEPKNYDRNFVGKLTLEAALIASRNIPVLRTLDALGAGPFQDLLHDAAEIPRPRVPRNLSIALGSFDLSPLEVARLYALIPRGGRPLTTEKTMAVEDSGGTAVLDNRAFFNENDQRSESLVRPEAASGLLEILKKVISDKAGTAYGAARAVGMDFAETAGKTGTTQNYRDAWFAGFTRDFTAVVWLGVDANIQMESGSGGRMAAPVWMRFVKAAYRGRTPGTLAVVPAAPLSSTNLNIPVPEEAGHPATSKGNP